MSSSTPRPDHLVLGVLDAQHVEPLGIDELGVVAVVGLLLVEDVPERIPVGGALHAQVQRVVGVADLVPVLPAGHGVGAGREHLMDRIEAAAEQAGLRAVAVERDAERKHFAGADQTGCLHDVLGRDLIERADLIVLAPTAPVAELLRGLRDRLPPHLDVHRLLLLILSRSHARRAPRRVIDRDCDLSRKLRPFGNGRDYRSAALLENPLA